MFDATYSLLNFVLMGLCWTTIALSTVLYLGRGSKSFFYIGIYAIVQLLLELKVHGAEIGSPLSQWLDSVFTDTVLVKGLLYGISGFLLLLVLFSVVDLRVKPIYLIVPSVLFVWLACFSMIRANSMFTYWLFLLPYEIFTFGLALLGLRRLKGLPEQAHFRILRRVFVFVLVFTVLTVAEDTLVCFSVGFATLFDYSVAKERNFCECVMQIILFANAIYAAGRILLGVLTTEPAQTEVRPPRNMKQACDLFACSIGLSRREMEVLPLLLENKSIQEISEAFVISQGTVKSHTHNIYQKADVSDRIGLIRKASAFTEEQG